jgi:hypothetical protein
VAGAAARGRRDRRDGPGVRARRAWWVAAVAGCGLVASPLASGRDSFPLSTYPMFSSPRGTTEPVTTAVLRRADGTVERLTPFQIARTVEIVSAAVTVRTEVNAGRAEALCADIAGRLDPAATGRGATVEVVTEVVDAIGWFRGARTPLERTVHAACPVD